MAPNVCLCYIRKSMLTKGATAASPEIQAAALTAWCLHHGYTPEWHRDTDGHSSGLTDQRPGWQRLIARIPHPDVAAIAVHTWDRAARNVRHLLEIVDLADQHRKRFAATSDQIDTKSADGRFQLTILAAVGEHYARRTGERRAAAIAYLRTERGRHYGLAPFGTERIPQNGDRVLVPSTKQQPNGTDHAALEHLYTTWFTRRLGPEALMSDLNAGGWRFRDRHGQLRPWTHDDVRRVLALHWVYAGYVVVGRSHHGPRELLPGSHAPILPAALTAPVAQHLAGTPKAGPRTRPPEVYVLTGLLYCACGRRLTGSVADGHRRYVHRGRCLAGHVSRYRADRLEQLARSRLASLPYPAQVRQAADAEILRYLASGYADPGADLAALQERARRLDGLYTSGRITLARYDALRAEYAAEAATARAAVARAPLTLTPAEALPPLADLAQTAEPEMLRELLRAVYARITLTSFSAITWEPLPWAAEWAGG